MMPSSRADAPQTLLVRADGGASTGLGHLVRSLAVAQAWEGLGGRAIFAVAPDLIDILRRFAAEPVTTETITAATGSEQDAGETSALATRCRADWILLDGYRFAPPYRAALRHVARLALVDDLADLGPYDVDALINHNVYATPVLYASTGRDIAHLLVGSRFALLRREFAVLRRRRRQRMHRPARLVVTLGGGDSRGHLTSILSGLAELPAGRATATLVVGPADPLWKSLGDAPYNSSIHLARGGAELPALLAGADLVIASAGGLASEICCLGVPALLVVLSADQRRVAATLESRGAALNLGEGRELDAKTYRTKILELLEDPQRRQEMSRAGRRLVDGRGAVRVARILRNEADSHRAR